MDSSCLFNYILKYKKKINWLNKKKVDQYYIDEKISDTFGLNVHFDDLINNRVNNFRLEGIHYRKLLTDVGKKYCVTRKNNIE